MLKRYNCESISLLSIYNFFVNFQINFLQYCHNLLVNTFYTRQSLQTYFPNIKKHTDLTKKHLHNIIIYLTQNLTKYFCSFHFKMFHMNVYIYFWV